MDESSRHRIELQDIFQTTIIDSEKEYFYSFIKVIY